MLESDDIAAGLIAQVSAFLGEHDPATTDRIEFLRARYAAGLAEVHYPAGDGGQGHDQGNHQQRDQPPTAETATRSRRRSRRRLC